MINNLSITVHAFARRISTSFSVDEVLLPRYVIFSSNFIGLPLRVEVTPSRLKHIYFILFAFVWRSVLPAVSSMIYSRDYF